MQQFYTIMTTTNGLFTRNHWDAKEEFEEKMMLQEIDKKKREIDRKMYGDR